jgi:hypothetical protein
MILHPSVTYTAPEGHPVALFVAVDQSITVMECGIAAAIAEARGAGGRGIAIRIESLGGVVMRVNVPEETK